MSSATKNPAARVPEAEHAARTIIARLREAGHLAYLAGGCVRDRLRGEQPADFDVATSAPPQAVQRLFKRTVPVGVQFGVVLVLIEGAAVEVAAFRSDAVYLDGRHPVSVKPASPQEDAARRDFTINGMFLDPETGEVIDYVGGKEDLAAGVIRAIGNPAARLHEDRLRMLRAVRFAARFDYAIDPATFGAIRRLAPAISGIAWERIGDEIVRVLTAGSARRGFELLNETGLLEHVLPEIAKMKGVEQSPDYHPEGDVFRHTLLALEQLRQPTETLALAVLLHDVAKPSCALPSPGKITFHGHCELGETMAADVCRRLRRSRATWERVAYLVRNHLRHLDAPAMRKSTLRRFLAAEGIDELLELARIDALASHGNLSRYEFCRARLEEYETEPVKPPPLLRGKDLVALGYAPGPQFKEILHSVEEEQLEGNLHTREEALAWLAEHHPSDPV